MIDARPPLISFEGCDGSGKSTQIKILYDILERDGHDVTLTREPGGSPGAEEIRRLLVSGDPDRWDARTEALLMFAARRDHVMRVIAPALDAGSIVLTDRFADSSLAYQGMARGLGRDPIETLWHWSIDGCRPDLTLILDVPAADGLSRARTGDEDRFERLGAAFYERVRAAFLDIAAREPARCVVIDATRTVAQVAADIRAAVRDRLDMALNA